MQSEALDRRLMLGAITASALIPWRFSQAAGLPALDVYKSPACGCCTLWVEHLEAAGFVARVQEADDLARIKSIAGVPDRLAACHTALAARYVIEGHVPAPAIRRLLAARPEVLGLAVPGMPAGSSGMPDPNPERYDVVAFGRGADRVFMSFVGSEPVRASGRGQGSG